MRSLDCRARVDGPFRHLAAFAGVASLTFLGLLLSLAVQLVISRHFGTSAALDGYLLAYTVTMSATFFIGPLRDSLGPQLYRQLEENPSSVEQSLRSLLAWALVGLVISSLAVALACFGLSRGFLPVNDAIRQHVVLALTWLLPAIALGGLSEMLNGLFACYDRPVWQQAVRLTLPVSSLAVVPILVERLDVGALALAVVLGLAAMVIAQWTLLARLGLRVRVGLPARLDRKLARVAAALLISYFLAQVYALVERLALAATEAGLLSAFNYAVVLTNVVITTLVLSIVNVAYPRILSASSLHHWSNVVGVLRLALSWLVFAAAGVATTIWIFAFAVVGIIFARGRFDAAAVATTAVALRATIFTCVPIGVYTLVCRALLVRQSSRGLAVAGLTIALTGIAIILAAALIGSRSLLISHWFLANFAGAGVALILTSSSLGSWRGEFIRAVGMALRPAAIAGLMCVLSLPFQDRLQKLAGWEVILIGAPLVLAGYVLICWLSGALPPFRGALRPSPASGDVRANML